MKTTNFWKKFTNARPIPPRFRFPLGVYFRWIPVRSLGPANEDSSTVIGFAFTGGQGVGFALDFEDSLTVIGFTSCSPKPKSAPLLCRASMKELGFRYGHWCCEATPWRKPLRLNEDAQRDWKIIQTTNYGNPTCRGYAPAFNARCIRGWISKEIVMKSIGGDMFLAPIMVPKVQKSHWKSHVKNQLFDLRTMELRKVQKSSPTTHVIIHIFELPRSWGVERYLYEGI